MSSNISNMGTGIKKISTERHALKYDNKVILTLYYFK